MGAMNPVPSLNANPHSLKTIRFIASFISLIAALIIFRSAMLRLFRFFLAPGFLCGLQRPQLAEPLRRFRL